MELIWSYNVDRRFGLVIWSEITGLDCVTLWNNEDQTRIEMSQVTQMLKWS